MTHIAMQELLDGKAVDWMEMIENATAKVAFFVPAYATTGLLDWRSMCRLPPVWSSRAPSW
jgi:hypothetical protein